MGRAEDLKELGLLTEDSGVLEFLEGCRTLFWGGSVGRSMYLLNVYIQCVSVGRERVSVQKTSQGLQGTL